MICCERLNPFVAAKSILFSNLLLILFSFHYSTTDAKSWYSGSEYFTQSKSINGQKPQTISYSNQVHQGFLGCLFSDICNNEEFCFDDTLFGSCLPKDGFDGSNLERFDSLSDTDREVINFEAHKLDNLGYSWSDEYLQCVLESLIFAIKNRTPFDEQLCSVFKNNNEDSSEQISPFDADLNDVAIVQNEDDPNPDDIIPDDLELNSSPPPSLQNQQQQQLFYPGIEDDRQPSFDDDNEILQLLLGQQQTPNNDNGDDSDGDDIILPFSYIDVNGFQNNNNNLYKYTTSNIAAADNDDDNQEDDDNILIPEIYDNDDENYIIPSAPSRFLIDKSPYFVESSNNNNQEIDPSFLIDNTSERRRNDENDEERQEQQQDEEEERQKDREIGSGIFNRNERYDVKKPGPFFPNSENNFFLNKLLDSGEENNNNDDSYVLIPSEDGDDSVTEDKQDQGQMEYENPILAPVKDKRDVFYDPITRDVYVNNGEDMIDDQYVHIGLKKRINTWQQGDDFIQALAQHFQLPEAALADRKIENQHVQFRVDPNPQNIDAKKMADEISNDSNMQKRLTNDFGVQVDKAQSGDKIRPNPLSFVSISPASGGLFGYQLMILVVVLASTLAALFVTGIILCLVRKKARRCGENKLSNFQDDCGGKKKVTEEYKDLCRGWSLSLSKENKKSNGGGNSDDKNGKAATSKNGGNSTNETPSATTTKSSAAGVTPLTNKKQLSKESEGSNRSSTSSWSAEDPSNTNMDISTGHMVLAYMEDHLKNKQRLEQEWVGLCGYEAEPCSTTVAFKSENKKKNRYPDKLPYDHNRVILNALLNSNNSDYINASTVADHDPRNPSYIVTQGPLGQTVPDFWQMIWEQGCVVIVMLTRLQDQEYTLCHRYWPEEGSEQYHIFEVHLVSEHVWCDDYLVRSVYLKNTRTGETRTVTQFHFRSWPAHGIPTSTKALLEFRRKVNKSYRGRSCPIAVHCSDGVGRSGTYVLIDMVLNRMSKGCKEIDIAATLEHIRDQRGGMVQNRSQFEFCLMAVAEEVHAILKALPQ